MTPTEPRYALEARDLRVTRGGRVVLDGVTLCVARGECAAIVGPSGSGKSTLVRALATLIPVDAGTLCLAGIDARTLAPTEYRTRVAYLPQQPVMLAGTVHDNLAAGPALHGRPLDPTHARALLASVGLDDALLSREARVLSGGERQRVALARALANEPEVLLLDEPTASLDPASGVQIVALVRGLAAGGRAVVMVTHVAEHADLLGGTRYRCEHGALAPVANGAP